MSNSLLNISMITRKALMELRSNLAFTAGVNRQYDGEFSKDGAKIGSVINIRKPVRHTVQSGKALNVQDQTDQFSPLTLDSQRHVDFQFSSQELTLNIDDFYDRYLKTAVTALAHEIDKDGGLLYKDVPSSVGAPGTAVSSLQTALQAGQKLNENGAPVDGLRKMIVTPGSEVGFLNAGLSLFNDQKELAMQYKNGQMGRAMGFDWGMDQTLPTHSTGAVDGTPLVDTTITTEGVATIHIDGITTASITGAYKKGDVIQIADVYGVNPQTKVSTGVLKQFVVTADADASGNEIAALAISPAIYLTGAYQNVDAYPVNGAAVTLFGAATTYTSKVSPVSLAYHRDAFVLGMADLALPGGVDMAARASDKESGLSMRIIRDYDINNDECPCRIDVLYGWKTVYPELACRVQG